MENSTPTSYINNFLNVEQQKKLFDQLYEDVNGYLLSSEGQRQHNIRGDKSLAYGEVSFNGLKEILDIIQPSKNSSICDLGSGTGKVLVIAALLYPFQRLVGIERLAPLVESSREVLRQFSSEVQDQFPSVQVPDYDCIEGSLVDVDLSSFDLIFSSSTCFDEPLLSAIESKVDSIKTGAYMVTLTKAIKHERLDCIHHGYHKMAWGSPTVFIYKKR